jgi:hypothetical protein
MLNAVKRLIDEAIEGKRERVRNEIIYGHETGIISCVHVPSPPLSF